MHSLQLIKTAVDVCFHKLPLASASGLKMNNSYGFSQIGNKIQFLIALAKAESDD